MNDITIKAAQFATSRHGGQLRDDGITPFITHPALVAKIIQTATNGTDDNLVAAAWLHDTVEDTSTTYADLLEHFNQDIADLVMEVTHEGQADSHGYYFPRLRTQRGIMLKFADRLSNLSDMSDVWPLDKQLHYLKKSKFWKSEGVDRGQLSHNNKKA